MSGCGRANQEPVMNRLVIIEGLTAEGSIVHLGLILPSEWHSSGFHSEQSDITAPSVEVERDVVRLPVLIDRSKCFKTVTFGVKISR